MGFEDVLLVHEHLRDLFFQHQESLLQLDLRSALERLEVYRRELAAHMRVEEELLLPVYRRAGAIPGGPPEFFTGEHERMRQFLARIAESLKDMQGDRTNLARQVIRVFDEEAAYKSLNDHHDQRERNILFPALDRVTTDEERSELIALCLAANKIERNPGIRTVG